MQKSKIHWEDIDVEKEIPIPVPPSRAAVSAAVFDRLEVNDSFAIPAKTLANLKSAIARYTKNAGKNKRFITRTVDDDRVRCWRIK